MGIKKTVYCTRHYKSCLSQAYLKFMQRTAMLLGAKEADAEKDMTNVTYCLPLLFFIPYDAILPQKTRL